MQAIVRQQLKPEPARAPLIVTEQQGGVEVIERLAAEWRMLCAEGRSAQPFFQPEWMAAYVRAFAADKTLVVLTARRQGQLRAVLPLVSEHTTLHGIPVRKLRSPSNVHSCRFDLVTGADDEAEAVQAIWQALQQRTGWDVIELLNVPEGGAGERLLKFAAAEGHRVGQWEQPLGAYLSLSASAPPAETLPTLISSKLRKSLRYYRRNLEKQGALLCQRITVDDPQTLARFYQLESTGWKGKEGTAIACTVPTRQFYDEVTRTATAFGYYTLYSLELNGQSIAMQYGLTYGGCFHLLKPAYDENFREYSPGHLLTAEVLCDLLTRGAQEYDFMSPLSEWKSRWAKSVRAQSHVYLFRRGFIGHALHAWKFRVALRARQLKQNYQAGLTQGEVL